MSLRAALSFFFIPFFWSLSAVAAGPQPPCAQESVPAFGAFDTAPSVQIWTQSDLAREQWQPPACLGWQGDSRLVAAIATRFHSSLSIDDLAERLTAVSSHTSIRFWAVSRQEWRPLVASSSLIDGPDGTAPLPDPSRSALMPGRDFHYAEETDVSPRSVHRLRVLEHTADRLVLVTENVTPVRALFFTLFEPGALQTATFVERDGPDGFRLYEITRVTPASSALAVNSASGYLNRLDSVRRHLAGLPTDRDPPLAPW